MKLTDAINTVLEGTRDKKTFKEGLMPLSDNYRNWDMQDLINLVRVLRPDVAKTMKLEDELYFIEKVPKGLELQIKNLLPDGRRGNRRLYILVQD